MKSPERDVLSDVAASVSDAKFVDWAEAESSAEDDQQKEWVRNFRIIADMDARVRLEMERHDISEAHARDSLKKDDLERRRWALALHGIDTVSPTLYDLVIHIRKFTVEDATDLSVFVAVGLAEIRANRIDGNKGHIAELRSSSPLMKRMGDVQSSIWAMPDDS